MSADDICVVNASKCFGCGVCVTECPQGTIRLEKKPDADSAPPPVTEGDWRRLRAVSRKLEAEFHSKKGI